MKSNSIAVISIVLNVLLLVALVVVWQMRYERGWDIANNQMHAILNAHRYWAVEKSINDLTSSEPLADRVRRKLSSLNDWRDRIYENVNPDMLMLGTKANFTNRVVDNHEKVIANVRDELAKLNN